MSLVARHLEANGIATLTFSNARDITASACNPRTVFTNYPLGNACGRPHDRENQREVLQTGFRLLQSATEPGTIVDTPFEWCDDDKWRRLVFTSERPWLSDKAEVERQILLEKNKAGRKQQEQA